MASDGGKTTSWGGGEALLCLEWDALDSVDCSSSGILDSCESDLDNDGIPDDCDEDDDNDGIEDECDVDSAIAPP